MVQTTHAILNFQLSFITKKKNIGRALPCFSPNIRSGNWRGAVRYLTDRDVGVVLIPDDVIGDGQTVRYALLEKNLEGSIPTKASFQDFKDMPLFVPYWVVWADILPYRRPGRFHFWQIGQFLISFEAISERPLWKKY